MKKIILAVALSFLAGTALATTFSDIDNAKQIVLELKNLQSTRDVQASQVEAITIVASVRSGPVTHTHSFTFKPADTGWNAFLSGINTMIGSKITALKTQLETLGVTSVPN
jgi:hypothetical protein